MVSAVLVTFDGRFGNLDFNRVFPNLSQDLNGLGFVVMLPTPLIQFEFDQRS